MPDDNELEDDAPSATDQALDEAWHKLEEGDVEGAHAAATALKPAAEEEGAGADVLLLLAACAREDGNIEQALECLREASQAEPEWATPELWMAEILAAPEADEAALKHALRHASNAVERAEEEEELLGALLLKARLEFDLGRTDAARATLDELPAVPLPDDFEREAAELELALENPTAARTRMESVVERSPDDAEAWYLLGVAAEDLGDEAAKRRAWRKTRVLDGKLLDEIDESERFPESEMVKEAEAALASLPVDARTRLTGIPMVVAELPALEDVSEGLDPRLLGLFAGTPYPDDTHLGSTPVLTQILLFRANLERVAADEASLRDEIRRTLLHETGHFFGLDEAELERAGLD